MRLVSILLGMAMLGCLGGAAGNDEPPTPGLQEVVNLQELGSQARAGKRVIMLLVSQEHCPFCVQIKQEIIGPMLKAGDHKENLLIREMFIDFGSPMVDFNGNRREGANIALDYGVSLTPTLLFLSPDGRELTRKKVGIPTPDMFFYYVDQSIQNAIAVLQQSAHG